MKEISEILLSKELKPKQKTEALCQALREARLSVAQLLNFAMAAKEAQKATCIEALEFLTQNSPERLDPDGFKFLCQCLLDKAPRVKWESAKVIGNTVHLHAAIMESCLPGLMKNAKDPGTVVRWSAAFALGKAAVVPSAQQSDLKDLLKVLEQEEEKASIRKFYTQALKEKKTKK